MSVLFTLPALTTHRSASRVGHPCTVRNPEAPKGSPGQWSFSSPGAHNGHPHRGPPRLGAYIYLVLYAYTLFRTSLLPSVYSPGPPEPHAATRARGHWEVVLRKLSPFCRRRTSEHTLAKHSRIMRRRPLHCKQTQVVLDISVDRW